MPSIRHGHNKDEHRFKQRPSDGNPGRLSYSAILAREEALNTIRVEHRSLPSHPSFRSAPSLHQLPPVRGERPDGTNGKETQ